MIKIYCKNLDRYIEIEGGATLLSLAVSVETELGFHPICARVNNKTESLSYEVYTPKLVEFQACTQDPVHVSTPGRCACFCIGR